MNFKSFNFYPQIAAGIAEAGYETPTPIQERAIPPIMEGRDLLGLAQTGTGKTAAFALPILQRLSKGHRRQLRALIVSPTRELAEQTHVAITALGRRTGLKSVTLYGGVSQLPQVKSLRAGVEIAVACPGRLLDLMKQRIVSLDHIEVLVLDEADQMFDMGFLPDIRRIIAAAPAARQTLLFSATMPKEIRSLADEQLHNPAVVEIGDSRPVETVSHAIYPVEQTEKTSMLLELLYNADSDQVLVFTRTKHRAKRLAHQLSKAGLSATSLQGNLSQNQRTRAMNGFRSGRIKVLVATDIAARGIDVSMVSHVINYDLPNTAEAYTHRIGRTGRMENLGIALSLVTPDDGVMIRTIERLIGSTLERRELKGFEAPRINTSSSRKAPSAQPGNRSQHNRRRNAKTGQSHSPRRQHNQRQKSSAR